MYWFALLICSDKMKSKTPKDKKKFKKIIQKGVPSLKESDAQKMLQSIKEGRKERKM